MRRPALATLALSLLALLFGWETRQALQATPDRQDNSAIVPAGAWRPGIPAPDPQPPSDQASTVAAVTARPLFRPDRQPFREQGPGASGRNYESELSRYTLLGVLGFGEVPFGVVVGKAGNKGERWEVKRGDSLPGFTVREVEMEGLRLTADGKEFLLPLYAGPPTAAPGAVRTGTSRSDTAPTSAAPPRAGAPPRPGGSSVVPGPAAPMAATVPGPTPQNETAASSGIRRVPPRYIPGRR